MVLQVLISIRVKSLTGFFSLSTHIPYCQTFAGISYQNSTLSSTLCLLQWQPIHKPDTPLSCTYGQEANVSFMWCQEWGCCPQPRREGCGTVLGWLLVRMHQQATLTESTTSTLLQFLLLQPSCLASAGTRQLQISNQPICVARTSRSDNKALEEISKTSKWGTAWGEDPMRGIQSLLQASFQAPLTGTDIMPQQYEKEMTWILWYSNCLTRSKVLSCTWMSE